MPNSPSVIHPHDCPACRELATLKEALLGFSGRLSKCQNAEIQEAAKGFHADVRRVKIREQQVNNDRT